jgi:RHS repeat-associated protein
MDPYGNPLGTITTTSSSGTTTPGTWPDTHGFLGKSQDASTGLTDVGARHYDPSIGRFVSVDPVLNTADAQSMNGYTYAGDNPTTGSDPSGLCPVDKCGAGTVNNGHLAITGPRDPGNPDAGSYYSGWFVPPAPDSRCTGHGSNTPSSCYEYDRNSPTSSCSGHGPNVPQSCYDYSRWNPNAGHSDGANDPILSFLGQLTGITDAWNCVRHGDIQGCAWTIATLATLGAGAYARAAAAGAETLLGASRLADGASQALADAARACAGNSFAGSTPVVMADGTSKPIDQVKVGDKVENASPDGLFVQQHTVTAVHVTDSDRAFDDLTVGTPSGPATITTTAYHLFWDVTTQKWTQADDLRIGDQLQTPTGQATVEASRHNTTAIRTYNLTIDNLHTYYVEAGTVPVLVHNCGVGDTTTMGSRGNPFRDGAPNVATDINGRTFTGHALDRMQQQGIVPSVVGDAIANGTEMVGKRAGTTAFYSDTNDLTVIIDTESGRVITADYGRIKQ